MPTEVHSPEEYEKRIEELEKALYAAIDNWKAWMKVYNNPEEPLQADWICLEKCKATLEAKL